MRAFRTSSGGGDGEGGAGRCGSFFAGVKCCWEVEKEGREVVVVVVRERVLEAGGPLGLGVVAASGGRFSWPRGLSRAEIEVERRAGDGSAGWWEDGRLDVGLWSSLVTRGLRVWLAVRAGVGTVASPATLVLRPGGSGLLSLFRRIGLAGILNEDGGADALRSESAAGGPCLFSSSLLAIESLRCRAASSLSSVLLAGRDFFTWAAFVGEVLRDVGAWFSFCVAACLYVASD